MLHAYLITDPAYYGHDEKRLAETLGLTVQKQHVAYACLRDKGTHDYTALAKVFLAVCRAKNVPHALLHSHVELAAELGADGVHLSSLQFDRITEAKAKGLWVIISTHTEDEMRRAAELGADAVTYSPVFATPGKGEPKGLDDLKDKAGKIEIKIFALGGITTPEQVEQVERCGVYGFASIRYFTENP